MGHYTGRFKCTILSPNELIYEDQVQSLFLQGDRGEYEILAYHYPLIGVLVAGDIIIDWKESIAIKGGVVRFFANECVVLLEESLKKQS